MSSDDAIDEEELREALREAIRLSPKHSATSLGLAVGDKGYVSDFLKGRKHSVKPDALMKIAAELEMPFQYFFGEWRRTPIADAIGTVPKRLAEDITKSLQFNYRKEPKFFGEPDFPIYSAVEGGPGEFVRNNEPIEVVYRPWYMRDVKKGFGVVVVGESMINKYEPGNIVIINPDIPPIKDKAAVFVSGYDGEREFRATLKMFRGQSATEWKVEQFNPPRTFTLEKSIWNTVWRVVGTYEGY